jgi:rRNA maturation endonuclease Nob1
MDANMGSDLEKQLEKVYICQSCGRTLRLAKHSHTCPYCGGQLAVKVVVEKEKFVEEKYFW